jgi:hypothetical protein
MWRLDLIRLVRTRARLSPAMLELGEQIFVGESYVPRGHGPAAQKICLSRNPATRISHPPISARIKVTMEV